MRISIFVASAGRASGGPEVYETGLLRGLAAIDKENEYHLLCLSPGARSSIGIDQENFHYHNLWPQIRPVSMLTSLPLQLMRRKSDVVHASFMPPPIKLQEYVFTLICYSMFQHPEFYPPAIRLRLCALMRWGVRTARLMLCISENVRDMFAEKFKLPLHRLVVTHLGVSPIFRPQPEKENRQSLKEIYGVDAPYFLFSGRWERRKNILGALKAFALFKKETGAPHKLVTTGSRTWAAREADAIIAREGLQREIIDVGKSPFKELPILYSGAEALIYPSFWEGFGLPIVEAMASGAPVITSNRSSMPEVAGGAALIVDPYSTTEIAEAMFRIISNDSLRASLRDKGLERAKFFTWERTAQRTLDAYRQMAAMD
jgi:glycosyltransferase involved in cell wall biosynthesis